MIHLNWFFFFLITMSSTIYTTAEEKILTPLGTFIIFVTTVQLKAQNNKIKKSEQPTLTAV